MEQLAFAGLEPLVERRLLIRKRDGRVEPFNKGRIYRAVESAFRADAGLRKDDPLPLALSEKIEAVAQAVVETAMALAAYGEELEVERIQDLVEEELMRQGYHSVARRYIVYREDRRKARALRGDRDIYGRPIARLHVTLADGTQRLLDADRLRRELMRACRGLEDRCFWQDLFQETLSSLYEGVREEEIETAMILAARSRVEREPAYSLVAARLLLGRIYREVLGQNLLGWDLQEQHRQSFPQFIQHGVEAGRLDPQLRSFDLERLAKALDVSRDLSFTYMGLQTLYDRYLLQVDDRRIETPQYFWMRVAMGLAIAEKENREDWAIRFYDVLSRFLFLSSTPTLFNSGTVHPQLSSCYLLTVEDDLEHIFKSIADNAKLSKWAGGLGNDWTKVRATGALIRGTGGRSQGVIPFLKVANDTAVAVNQGGKRKGALCAYLETWHLDIEDFLELRRNTGDERRRTHDMNTANWIPDLFMKRVLEDGSWTLFSPDEVPDLHELYGQAFEKRYVHYEKLAEEGKIRLFKKVSARELWRKMLTMLFETGHPWITFKDPSNIRSQESHAGVIHCSNLCTEVLLPTSKDEVAVCNLGSINLAAHVTDRGLDEEKLASTIRIAMRMLDNVIDINFYPIPEARSSNLRHRPVGLGIMGFQDALYRLRIPYASQEAVEFSDSSMELISYYAILASSELARERGPYPAFKGSKWDQGLLPFDTIDLLEKERGGCCEIDRTIRLDWTPVRESIRKYGMRNSHCLAIAPTATISNITGVSQSIEPTFKNLFVKSNLSGDFTTINAYLVEDLKRLGLWDEQMLDDLKYYDGSVQPIERIPAELKELYRTAFEIEPRWLIECASRRQKWIDMGQSLNLYIAEPSGKLLSEMYMLAWKKGLKTTYYLRASAATTIEKSTLDVNARGIAPRWLREKGPSANLSIQRGPRQGACSAEDGICESCQ